MKKKSLTLTPKEILFAEHYLCTFNATDAARKAGYSERTARQQGYENLTKPYIQNYIQEKTSATLEKLGITQEKVIRELARIAFSDITECLQGEYELRDLNKIGPETTAAVKNIRVTKNGFKIDMHDKVKALEKILEILKFSE